MSRTISVCLSLALASLLAFTALLFVASAFADPSSAEAGQGLRAGKCDHGQRYHHRLKKVHKLAKHKRLCHFSPVPQPEPQPEPDPPTEPDPPPQPEDSRKPNMIMVMTNDQDAQSVPSMPYTSGEFASRATTFPNFTFNFSLCCSSRTSILRGQYTHSHGVWDNIAPTGGYEAWKEKGLNDSYLARWMDEAGYETGMFGNYLNGFNPFLEETPPGWDRFVHSGFTEEKVRTPAGTYDDEHTKSEALSFLEGTLGGPEPAFAWVSFDAPHHPYGYDPAYTDRFSDEPLPKGPAFGEEDASDKPAYVNRWRVPTADDEAHLTEVNRNRLRSLLTVDDAMERIVGLVEEKGEAEETYIVFLSDNGYMMGQHRIREMKRVPYLESTSFPLMVKGPGVAAGAENERVVMNQDLPAFFADLAGAPLPDFVDGRSFRPLLEDPANAPWREVGLMESPNKYDSPPFYRGLRGEGFTYVRYETGEHEYYDLSVDPYQLDNRYADLTEEQKAALDARVDAIDGCAGEACRPGEDAPLNTTGP